jgi:prevent-host-death family protein
LTGDEACDYNDHMAKVSTVGARELKTRLGTYLRRVRGGRRVLVTDRGIPVAELRGLGVGEETLEGRLQRLEALGLVSQPTRLGLVPLKGIRSSGASVARTVVEDREDRF